MYSPSIFLDPHTLPSQVFRFALVSSSLVILSFHSRIKIQENRKQRTVHGFISKFGPKVTKMGTFRFDYKYEIEHK